MILQPNTRQHNAQREQKLYTQPADDVQRLRPLEQFAAVLDANQRLADHYAHVHPALRSDALTRRIGRVAVVLLHRRRHNHADEY